MESFIDALGEICNGKSFEIPKAIETLKSISNFPYFELIECRKVEEPVKEVIVVKVEVEISQKPKYNIRSFERIAILFPQSNNIPHALALRKDFPITPHQYLTANEIPRMLCLFEESNEELNLKWTPALLLERIFQWLSLSAKDELHQSDQPLEPLFLPSDCPVLFIPIDIFENDEKNNLLLIRKTIEDNNFVLVAEKIEESIPYQNEIKHLAICIRCKPIIHGIIKKYPTNIYDLDIIFNNEIITTTCEKLKKEYNRILDFRNSDYFSKVIDMKIDSQKKDGIIQFDLNQIKLKRNNLIHELHSQMVNNFLNSWITIIANVPIKRNSNEQVEIEEYWSFIVPQTVKEFGINIGIWNKNPENKILGSFIKRDPLKTGKDIPLQIANSIKPYSRSLATQCSNINDNHSKQKYILVGVGALGSQMLINCIRMGIGNWSVIDHDIFYPHNLSRHSLTGIHTGNYKAQMLESQANDIIRNICNSYVENVLHEDFPATEIEKVFQDADLIIDISTSVPVARKLTRDINSTARRVSMFLSPSGSDSVILAEDSKRNISLDVIEMQYYRAIIQNNTLKNHLLPIAHLRYAGSCRDFANRISQDVVAFHASLCSRMFLKLLNNDNAQIHIMKYDINNIKLNTLFFEVYKSKTINKNGWTIIFDEYFTHKISEYRIKKLPNETGGVIIGTYDMQRKIVYIVDTILSPADSEEWPMNYKRGIAGLSLKINKIKDKTAGILDYIGEWHSHPNNVSISPSTTDKKAFNLLIEELEPLCYPSLMIIVGEKSKLNILTT